MNYRLYFRDTSAASHIVSCEEIEAPDDVEAIRQASLRAGANPMDLWLSEREVAKFMAVPKAQADE